MLKRRVVFTIDVEYGTSGELLQKIPGILRSVVENQKLVTFDRAHFAAYKDWSLRFEVVYFVLSADYNLYMDIHQSVNFGVYEAFEKLKINFAFPTQSLHIRPAPGADSVT